MANLAGGQAIAVAGIENPEKILGQQYEPGYLTLKQGAGQVYTHYIIA